MLIKHPQSASAQFHASAHQGEHHRFLPLLIGCIGVVYGDIATSPLYSFRECMLRLSGGVHGGEAALPLPADIFGIVSLLLWSLFIIVTAKYVLFLLHADNRGEGGMLSLTALAQKGFKKPMPVIVFLAILGAALFYGDATITPAISVLSAVEGLQLVMPHLQRAEIIIIALVVLILLFALQSSGTARVSTLFGPVMTAWVLIIGIAGVPYIVRHPQVFAAFNPAYGVEFLIAHRSLSLVILGAVFLAITGAEALYEDLGHFGRKPIQMAWLGLIFPCLTLNYLGQAGLMLERPELVRDPHFNPFFQMAPHWALLPLVILATLATVIASQAVITGTFSLTRSAIQLGLLPRMEIRHTSEAHAGQIFMPKINRMLMWTVLVLVVMFQSSTRLASAYGIAVTGTLLVTSALVFVVLWKTWNKSLFYSLGLVVPFVLIELVFLAANLLKLFDGGIVPLLLASFLVVLMLVWMRGSKYLLVRTRRQTVPLHTLIHSLQEHPPHIIPGTAVFLTGDSRSAPIALVQNLRHNKVLHEHNIILTVVTARIPKVPISQRAVIEVITPFMTSVVLNFGYSETPDVPRALALAPKLRADMKDASYFLGRRTLIPDGRRGLPEWQDHLFIPMARAATTATDFYRLPPNKVVELGIQIAV